MRLDLPLPKCSRRSSKSPNRYALRYHKSIPVYMNALSKPRTKSSTENSEFDTISTMDSVEERHIDVGRGFHYRYYTTSNDSAVVPSSPALLLLHGFPDDAQEWQYVLPHLLPLKLKIIIPDLLGYGGTSKPTDPKAFEIGAMCQDMVEILHQEGVSGENRVIPIGHDWGAYLAQRFYMIHTSLCAGLVTMSAAIIPLATQPFNLEAMNKATEKALGMPAYAYWELFLSDEGVKLMESRPDSLWHALHGDGRDWMEKICCVRGSMQQFLEGNRQDNPLRPYATDEKFKAQWMASHDPAKGGGGLLSPTNWYRVQEQNVNLPIEAKLSPEIEKPYLFVGCEQEFVHPSVVIGLAKQNGWCKDLTEVSVDSGHWVPYEKPEEVGKAVVEWLTTKGMVKI